MSQTQPRAQRRQPVTGSSGVHRSVLFDPPSRSAIDRVGAVASSACAVHCALCALLPGVVGALGLSALLGHEAEWTMTLVAIVFASMALLFGWPKHRSWRIAVSLSVGIAGLMLSRLLEEAGGPVLGTALGILAGVVLVIGHVWNLRASRRCQTVCP